MGGMVTTWIARTAGISPRRTSALQVTARGTGAQAWRRQGKCDESLRILALWAPDVQPLIGPLFAREVQVALVPFSNAWDCPSRGRPLM